MYKEGPMGAFALALERQVFVAQDYILREGELGQDMYLIASGEVAVVTGPQHQHIEVTRLREGAFFGEMALLEKEPERHMATAHTVALSPPHATHCPVPTDGVALCALQAHGFGHRDQLLRGLLDQPAALPRARARLPGDPRLSRGARAQYSPPSRRTARSATTRRGSSA
jgi:hypothetical protein